MKPIILASRAELELEEAVEWYNKQQPGIGEKFAVNVEQIFTYIQLQPLMYPILTKEVRKAKISDFPFIILYIIHPKNISIISIFNCRRNPVNLVNIL